MNEFRSIEAISADALAELMNESFWGYFVQFEFTGESLAARMHFDGVDAQRSKILEVDGEVAGLALIAPRPAESRLATMGLRPEFRGQGLGREMLKELLRESVLSGERRMVLEVIQRNEAAYALYESEGFRTKRELLGYSRRSDDPVDGAELVEIAPEELAHAVAEHGDPDPPWQLSAESLARLGAQARCYRAEAARVAVARMNAEEMRILALVTDPARRREGAARRMMHGLFEEYPGTRWVVPPVCPPGSASGFLDAMGFELLDLRQFEMVRDCDALNP